MGIWVYGTCDKFWSRKHDIKHLFTDDDVHLELVVMVEVDLFLGTATTAPHVAVNTPLDPCVTDTCDERGKMTS